jgi:two-component system phosphate regulon sensor histidine kinase PhoR
MATFVYQMKLNRTYLFIAISSIALLSVLIIQVNWILKTAAIKEGLFNEKANMVLSRTTEALRNDKETCAKIGECFNKDDAPKSVAKLGVSEMLKVDSLFRHYMKYYNFHVDYSFVVIKAGPVISGMENDIAGYSFNKPLEEVARINGLELKLIFPEKKQFIFAELGYLFITSLVLILVVLFLFWRTSLSLMKEQKISGHIRAFLNNMTHEFKTPITNIALADRMIMKHPVILQEKNLMHYTEIIKEENEKLRLQVEQVLSMSALEKGEISLKMITIDFHALIQESVKSFSIQIEDRQGSINLELNSKNHLILGDSANLTNVFCNLIDNAIKYSREKPDITIRTRNSDNVFIVSVSDKGTGIDKEYKTKVFDKYFRVSTGDVHDVKGFGLGLAYVKEVIDLHGGTIELESEKGKGSVFTISLPYA